MECYACLGKNQRIYFLIGLDKPAGNMVKYEYEKQQHKGKNMSDEFIMFVLVPILLCPVGWISLKICEFYDNCPWQIPMIEWQTITQTQERTRWWHKQETQKPPTTWSKATLSQAARLSPRMPSRSAAISIRKQRSTYLTQRRGNVDLRFGDFILLFLWSVSNYWLRNDLRYAARPGRPKSLHSNRLGLFHKISVFSIE